MLSCEKQTDGMSARPTSSSGLLRVEKKNNYREGGKSELHYDYTVRIILH